MPTRYLTRLIAVFGIVVATGCASTKVVKDPGPGDCGFRYYRSKPYLMISPAVVKSENTTEAPTPHRYTLEVKYLPDFTEEYSVHIRAGLGLNETSLTLNEQGVLMGVNAKLDSNAANLISAAAGAIPNVASVVGGGGRSTGQGLVGGAGDTKFTVIGKNVPIGLYEAVLGRGPDGAKRMYGWRYLGFTPFAQCPLDSAGAVCAPCDQLDLYGLVWTSDGESSGMVFARLNEIAQEQKGVKAPNVIGKAPETPPEDQGQGVTPKSKKPGDKDKK